MRQKQEEQKQQRAQRSAKRESYKESSSNISKLTEGSSSQRIPSPEKKSSTPIQDKAVLELQSVTKDRIQSNLELQQQRAASLLISPLAQHIPLPNSPELTLRQIEKLPVSDSIPGSFDNQASEEEDHSINSEQEQSFVEFENFASTQLFPPEFSESEEGQELELPELSSAFEQIKQEETDSESLFDLEYKEGSKTPPPFAFSFGQAISPGFLNFNPNSQQTSSPRNSLYKTTITMSGSSSTMPRPGSRDAPRLTAEGTDDPMKVRRYFDDLENLFTDCNINNELDKKKWTVRYPEEQVAWEWKAMSEYSTATSTFTDFKKVVLSSYPGATDEERGTMRELNRLFKKYKNIGSDDLDEYMALVRRFRAVKKELNPPQVAGAAVQPEPLVTNRELVEKFTRALDIGFRNAIFAALHIKGKTRTVPAGQKVRPDDMYDIDEVIAQGEAIARGTMPGTDPMSSVATNASSSYAPPVHIKQEQFQQQINDLISEKIAVLMDSIKISQDQVRQENSKQINEFMRTYQQNNVARGNVPQGYASHQVSAGFEANPVKSQNVEMRDNNKAPYDWHGNLSKVVCYFCSEEGHVANDCNHRQDLLELGRIVLVNGRARLPGNYPIPRQPIGAVSEKDRIDYYYLEKEKRDKDNAKQVNLVQSTPNNIPGMINTATMSTYLSNQLSDKDLRIANLEKELQSLNNPASQMMYQMPGQMNQFMQQPFYMPQPNPMMQSQFSQVGWNPSNQLNSYVPSTSPTMHMLNSMYQNQNSMTPNYPNMGMHTQPQQSLPTMAEIEAFVQTRRQKEESEK